MFNWNGRHHIDLYFQGWYVRYSFIITLFAMSDSTPFNLFDSKLRKSLAAVKYHLYFSNGGDASATTNLSSVRDDCIDYLKEYTAPYIYQNEHFNLKVSSSETCEGLHSLEGSVNFGENIDDEWFVVFLLYRLSLWSKYNFFVRVVDEDGQFLLIQAALKIPYWANPGNCDNRVFLYRGRMLLIPLEVLPGSPMLVSCLEATRSYIASTTATGHCAERDAAQKLWDAGDGANEAMFERVGAFPASVSANMHRTHLYVPKKLAHVLQKCPSLLPHAVNAFYFRNADESKICQGLASFPPQSSSDKTRVTLQMTRCLYAQLRLQHLEPRSPSFREFFPADAAKNQDETRWSSLGMKLACGFEILYEQQRRHSSNLFNHGNVSIKGVLASYTGEGVVSPAGVEDSEEWMTLDPQQFEKHLNENYSDPTLAKDTANAKNEQETFERQAVEFKNEFNNFLKGVSGIDGIEIAGDTDHVEGASSDEEGEVNPGPDEGIKLDASRFFNILNSLSGVAGDQTIRNDGDAGEGDGLTVKDFMDAMDEELSHSTASKTFARAPTEKMQAKSKDLASDEKKPSSPNQGSSATEQSYNLDPIDLDFNLVSSLMESFQHQNGVAGPVSNLFGEMGLPIPNADGNRETNAE